MTFKRRVLAALGKAELMEIARRLELDEGAANQGRTVRGPGLPDHLDPKDPRFTSTDCIEPPQVDA